MTKIVQANCATNQVVEREMNAEELNLYQIMVKNGEDAEKEVVARDSAKQSAMEKLAKLGLTDSEILALLS